MTDVSIEHLPLTSETYSLWDRCLIWKDRVIAKREFQRFVSRVPFLKRISQARAHQVFDLMAGFVYSQILLACVQSNLFERLKDGPLSFDELLAKVDLPAKGLERLLLAAVSLKLLNVRSKNRYGLGVLGAPLVNNHALCAMIVHHQALYHDLQEPLTLLRGQLKDKALETYWPYITEHNESLKNLHTVDKVAQYSELMSASLPLVADEVIAAYSFAEHRCLLDVGGGQGTFIKLLQPKVKSLQFQIFDLPGVTQLAQMQLNSQTGVAPVDCYGGDFFVDALPSGADIVTLIRVLFDHDDARVKQLLRKVFLNLPQGGKLLIAEPMAETPDIPAMGQAYFGFYLLAMGRGRPRTAGEIANFLYEAGFVQCELLKNSMTINAQILLAQK